VTGVLPVAPALSEVDTGPVGEPSCVKGLFKAEGNSMSYVIAEPCIDVKDKACVEVCPVDCIYEGPHQEGPHQLFINADECIDCGACEPVCPVKAIFAEDEVPEPSKPFIELNKQFFVDNPGVKPCTTRN
jgi:NAD-dependent dihydropyrimidine dehydrogenase PreA subunit